MKIIKKIPRYSSSHRIHQYPWNLSKMVQLRKRKWSRIKFSSHYFKPNYGRAINFRFFKTYRLKTKKLFRRFFSPKLTDRQLRKLFRSNSRYKATFKRVLKSEHRFDTLIFRIFMFNNMTIVRDLIKSNFFLLNGRNYDSPHIVLNVGDLVEISNKFSWKFLYNHLLTVISTTKKYFSRLFFKMSFPFVINRQRRRIKEMGKHKEKRLLNILGGKTSVISKREHLQLYKRLKKNTLSKTIPAKIYKFRDKAKKKSQKELDYVIKRNLNVRTNFMTRRFPHSKFFRKTFNKKKLINSRKLIKELVLIKNFMRKQNKKETLCKFYYLKNRNVQTLPKNKNLINYLIKNFYLNKNVNKKKVKKYLKYKKKSMLKFRKIRKTFNFCIKKIKWVSQKRRLRRYYRYSHRLLRRKLHSNRYIILKKLVNQFTKKNSFKIQTLESRQYLKLIKKNNETKNLPRISNKSEEPVRKQKRLNLRPFQKKIFKNGRFQKIKRFIKLQKRAKNKAKKKKRIETFKLKKKRKI